MEYLAVYDIADSKRLRHIAKIMKRYGVRVQKSVFECDLADSAIKALKEAVISIMDEKKDTLRIYPMLDNSRGKQIILGRGEFVEFPEAYII